MRGIKRDVPDSYAVIRPTHKRYVHFINLHNNKVMKLPNATPVAVLDSNKTVQIITEKAFADLNKFCLQHVLAICTFFCQSI